MNKKILLLGSYCGDDNYPLIYKFFKGNITVSNSEYEKTMMNGFVSNGFNVEMFSAPSVGKYPITCRKEYVSGFNEHNKIHIIKYHSFLPIIFSSKVHGFIKGLKKFLKTTDKNDNIVVVACEPHLPYLRTLKFIKHKYGFKTSLIVPDLPENVKGSKSKIYNFIKNKQVKEVYNLANTYVDSYLFFTKQMISKFDVNEKKYIVREGAINSFIDSQHIQNKDTVCTYIGKTNEQNGVDLILRLAEEKRNIKFDIYGNGDMDQKLSNSKLPNLNYFGFINPVDVDQKILSSDILLSPRYPRNYTNYSFPSKILKYISFKKPIVTFKLPCYPDAFNNILYYPKNTSYESFKEAFELALNDKEKYNGDGFEKTAGYLLASSVAKDYYSILF